MSCNYLSFYRYGQDGGCVASCVAKGSPYVPSLCNLENFCQSGRHTLCPFYLLAGLGAQADYQKMPALAASVGSANLSAPPAAML